MKVRAGMKPQDILVLLKILLKEENPWRFSDLANELEMSVSEVHSALVRSQQAGLMDTEGRQVFHSALIEFLLHGLRYVFPAIPGSICRGMPTSHSAPPLSKQIVQGEEKYVWPDDDGRVRGQSITPLYSSAPSAAKKDPRLYELLALIDALRVGRTREKTLAQAELKKRIKMPKSKNQRRAST
jgi:hypothetical protein